MRYELNVDSRVKLPDDMTQKFWDLPTYVAFAGPVTEESGKKFVESLEAAENAARRSGQEVLPVTINSPGGSVYAARGMIDAIRNCKIPVATIAESKAMSCGAWLLTAGAEGHRYCNAGATVMIHPCSTGARGKISDIEVTIEEGQRLNEIMLKEMAKNCGHHETYFKDYLKTEKTNADWYLDAQEALKHKIVNHIGAPTIKIDVKMDFKIKP